MLREVWPVREASEGFLEVTAGAVGTRKLQEVHNQAAEKRPAHVVTPALHPTCHVQVSPACRGLPRVPWISSRPNRLP